MKFGSLLEYLQVSTITYSMGDISIIFCVLRVPSHFFFQGKGKLLKLPQLIDMSAQVIFVSTQKSCKIQITISLIHKGQFFQLHDQVAGGMAYLESQNYIHRYD